MRFQRGDKVLRDMGIAGGHWIGVISRVAGDDVFDDPYPDDPPMKIADGRVVVLFGADSKTGVSIGFNDNDPHLKPCPEDLDAIVESDAQRRKAHPSYDYPLWPPGMFPWF